MRIIFPLLLLALVSTSQAQDRRPVPYPVIPTVPFQQAIEAGTRTTTGHPGPNYWTNTADYTIEATLDPATARIGGSVDIVYTNHSPDTLRTLWLNLYQNLNAPGAVRNRPQKLTEGVSVSRVAAAGQELEEYPSLRQQPLASYVVNGTHLRVVPANPVSPHSTVSLSIDWTAAIPEPGAPRMGQDGEIYFIAYWYPQMVVYDDVDGWKNDPYMGNGEFYMGYGDYDVKITVPQSFVMGATGVLQNPKEVLTEETRSRLASAASTKEIVAVVTEADFGKATNPSETGTHTWHFTADQVRDFAFGTSERYLWDATSAQASEDETALIHAFYRPEKDVWKRAAEFSQFSIEFLSDMFVPYPYPHMTAVEGVIGGGMEFPMITHIGGDRDDERLFSVTFHEIAHMWFPMMVGQDEKNFTWMDEGLTSFNTNDAKVAFWKDESYWNPERQAYYYIAGTGDEVESMRHGDRYPLGTAARGIASYNKPAVAFQALRGLVGEEAFMEAYLEYLDRWTWKHPQPFDMFNTFEDVLGMDLDWFWTTLFFETWTLDQAITGVSVDANEGVVVSIEDLGLSPMPAPVRVTYAGGRTEEATLSVDTWMDGQTRSASLTFPAGNVTKVEIDPDRFMPDVDRSNNTWEAN